MKKILKLLLKLGLAFLFAVFFLSLILNLIVIKKAEPYIYSDPKTIFWRQTILVLGAQVYRQDTLSYVLEDRVAAGVNLLQNKRANKLLLSGDHGTRTYDEVNAMRKYVQRKAPEIPQASIFLDHAGFNTYDSLYRAKEVFDVNNVIIVTQEFHIARAVFIAKSLGIDAVGFSVSQSKYSRSIQSRWETREYFARVKAFWDAAIIKRPPRFLGEVISVYGDGKRSWD